MVWGKAQHSAWKFGSWEVGTVSLMKKSYLVFWRPRQKCYESASWFIDNFRNNHLSPVMIIRGDRSSHQLQISMSSPDLRPELQVCLYNCLSGISSQMSQRYPFQKQAPDLPVHTWASQSSPSQSMENPPCQELGQNIFQSPGTLLLCLHCICNLSANSGDWTLKIYQNQSIY